MDLAAEETVDKAAIAAAETLNKAAVAVAETVDKAAIAMAETVDKAAVGGELMSPPGGGEENGMADHLEMFLPSHSPQLYRQASLTNRGESDMALDVDVVRQFLQQGAELLQTSRWFSPPPADTDRHFEARLHVPSLTARQPPVPPASGRLEDVPALSNQPVPASHRDLPTKVPVEMQGFIDNQSSEQPTMLYPSPSSRGPVHPRGSLRTRLSRPSPRSHLPPPLSKLVSTPGRVETTTGSAQLRARTEQVTNNSSPVGPDTVAGLVVPPTSLGPSSDKEVRTSSGGRREKEDGEGYSDSSFMYSVEDNDIGEEVVITIHSASSDGETGAQQIASSLLTQPDSHSMQLDVHPAQLDVEAHSIQPDTPSTQLESHSTQPDMNSTQLDTHITQPDTHSMEPDTSEPMEAETIEPKEDHATKSGKTVALQTLGQDSLTKTLPEGNAGTPSQTIECSLALPSHHHTLSPPAELTGDSPIRPQAPCRWSTGIGVDSGCAGGGKAMGKGAIVVSEKEGKGLVNQRGELRNGGRWRRRGKEVVVCVNKLQVDRVRVGSGRRKFGATSDKPSERHRTLKRASNSVNSWTALQSVIDDLSLPSIHSVSAKNSKKLRKAARPKNFPGTSSFNARHRLGEDSDPWTSLQRIVDGLPLPSLHTAEEVSDIQGRNTGTGAELVAEEASSRPTLHLLRRQKTADTTGNATIATPPHSLPPFQPKAPTPTRMEQVCIHTAYLP